MSPDSDDDHPFIAKSSRPLNPYALVSYYLSSEIII
jgi:hypothetical protein